MNNSLLWKGDAGIKPAANGRAEVQMKVVANGEVAEQKRLLIICRDSIDSPARRVTSDGSSTVGVGCT